VVEQDGRSLAEIIKSDLDAVGRHERTGGHAGTLEPMRPAMLPA
jgi:hypothetical protein